MVTLSETDVFIFITQLGLIVLAARLFGEFAKRLNLPILVGEVVAGIVLGPAVFGKFLPGWQSFVFPQSGAHNDLLEGISWLCAFFLLLLTGLEIDFQASLKHGKQNILTSLLGFLFPFLSILALSNFLPASFYKNPAAAHYTNLLLATALSVASVPVIGKILFDLKIFRSNVGLNIITSSVLSDIWEWSTLLVIIALATHESLTVFGILKPLLAMFLFLTAAFTFGRLAIDKIFDFLDIKAEDAAAVLAFLFSLTLLNGTISHLLGIHVVFGAFITGLAVGESNRITPYMRQSIQDFIFGIFAPIFFALIGMQLRFDMSQSWIYFLILFFVASLGKISGAFLGALFGGIGRKNALAVGCGLNTQGAMGVVVALIGVDLGLFGKDLFSIIVMISIVSSLLVGPLLKWSMRGVRRPLVKYFTPKHIFLNVSGQNKHEVIDQMVRLMRGRSIVEDSELVRKSIWQREESLSTAIGDGVALPHARIANFKTPILCFFKLSKPVDFDSPDNVPVQLLFLGLTDSNDDGMQLNLISQVARFLSAPDHRRRLLSSEREEEIYSILSLDETV